MGAINELWELLYTSHSELVGGLKNMQDTDNFQYVLALVPGPDPEHPLARCIVLGGAIVRVCSQSVAGYYAQIMALGVGPVV